MDGPLPLWFQIADRLLAGLSEGEFVPGDLLPSESELTTRFGVSRTTARAALDHIEGRGLIVRRPGIGSMVCAPPVEETRNVLSSFSEEMSRRGSNPGFAAASVQVEPATAVVSKALSVAKGQPVWRLEAILLADEEPIAMNRSWFSPAAVPPESELNPSELLSGSVYDWIESSSGLRVAYGEETIEASIADRQLASQLRMRLGNAVLTARRTARTADHAAIEYSVRQYRGDRYHFRINLSTA